MMNLMTRTRSLSRSALSLITGFAVVGAVGFSAAAVDQSRSGQSDDRERTMELRERADQQRERAEQQDDRALRERERQRERRARQRDQQRGLMQDATLLGQRVAVMVGEGLHDMETLAPIGYLTNRGARVMVIGIEPGEAQAYNSDVTIRVQLSVADVRVDQFDALVLPGGRGPSVLRENDDAVQFAKEFFESGKPVAAICHGPQVLVTAGVLEGRSATCIAEIASELREGGAEYKDEAVVVDGNLITSRVPDDIPLFVKAIERQMIEHREQAGDRARQRDRMRDRAPERGRERGRPGRGDGRGGARGR